MPDTTNMAKVKPEKKKPETAVKRFQGLREILRSGKPPAALVSNPAGAFGTRDFRK